MRRLADAELPLQLCLRWVDRGSDALNRTRLVLQENDTGEIMVSHRRLSVLRCAAHYASSPFGGWHDFVSSDEVLSRTGLFDVSYTVRKRRLGLFGHVARLRSDVPANQILRICTKTRDGERPALAGVETCQWSTTHHLDPPDLS